MGKMSGHNKQLGARGEKKALRYLFWHGWKILERNFKNPFGEIDIIAKKRDTVAFIEVKTRETNAFGVPSEAVLRERKQRYIMGANFYFSGRIIDCTVRFDIIEVYRGRVNHIENAFTA